MRVPWVPGIDADDQLPRDLPEFVLSLPSQPAVELMPYHRLGIGRSASLGLESPVPEDIPGATANSACEGRRAD